jgi:hypothetical protein
MTAVGKLLTVAIGICTFFGLALIGLFILAVAGRTATTRLQIIVWGIVGSSLILLNCAFVMSLAGLNSAASGSQDSYHVIAPITWFFLACIVAYFTLTLLALHLRKKKLNRTANGKH